MTRHFPTLGASIFCLLAVPAILVQFGAGSVQAQSGQAPLGQAQPGEAQPAGYDRATLTVLRWDPSAPNRVYAGTVGWGLVVSEDAGHTWSATAPQLGGRYIQSIAVHPLLPDVVVVGTLRQGVWQSVDGGKNFMRKLVNLPEVDVPAVSMSLEVSEESEDPTDLTLWLALRVRGPVRSDQPLPSTRTPGIARMQPFHDLTAHPVLPGEVLVAGRGVVARTRDGGETWTRVFNPVAGQFRKSPHFLRGVDPASCRSVAQRFYRVTAEPETIWLAACYGLFVSRDGGAAWNIALLGGVGRVLQVAADPTNPANLAVSTDAGVLRSADGGSNWQYVRAAAPGSPFGALTMLPGGELLAGGFGGEVVRADADGNVSVGRLRELQATQRDSEKEAERRARRSTAPYDRSGLAARPEADPRLAPGIDLHVADLVFHPNFANVVFAGTRRGVFRSEDGGRSWRHSSLGLGEMEVSDLLVDASAALIDPPEPDPAGERIMLWAATRGGGIYRSTSSGRSWQPVAMPDDGVVRTLLQDERDPYTLWAGTADGGVYRSVDAGASWHAASEGLLEGGVRVLAQSEGMLLAGTDNGGIFASYDDGDMWHIRGSLSRRAADESQDLELFESVGLDPKAMHIHDLLADPDDSDRLIAASTFGVFRSDDGGATWKWTKLRRGVERLVRERYDEDQIYAATTRGLWWTEDGGETWRQADFGRALNDLSLRADVDPTQSIREVPPLFGLALTPGGDVLAGTDRGQVVRGSAEFGGWKVAHLVSPSWVERPKGGEASRKAPDREPTEAEKEAYEHHRRRRDRLLVASALAPRELRRTSRPRSRILLALEARRRGEIPDVPPEIYDALPLGMRAELDKEDVATRVLGLADGDLRGLQTRLIDGWGVDGAFFGPLGRVLAVQSSVDDGRRSQTELRLYDLERRYLQPVEVFRRQGPTQHWKVLHDLARKPQAAQPDWLLEDTGPLLLWRRGEILVTRPRDDRVAIWRLTQRSLDPAPATPIQPGTVRGFPLPVAAVSLSEDGKWLGAVDVAGRPLFASMAGGRDPELIELPVAEDDEQPSVESQFQHVHATSKQLLLLGPSGIVAYRWGPKGPILETPEGDDAGEHLFGSGAGFSDVVADRKGEWMAALPAPSDEGAQTLVVIAFRDGAAAAVHRLDTSAQESWTATVSAQQEWLAVHRRSEDESESMLYEMRGNLVDAGPSLVFRVSDAAGLRFGAGGEHLTFTADGENQVWSLRGAAPQRVEIEPPNLHHLAQEFQNANPVALAAFFFEGEPRMADIGEWMPFNKHGSTRSHFAGPAFPAKTSPDGRWLAVTGPGRLVRLWHFDDAKGNLAPATGSLILDLARFRPYPSTFPSSLDAWPQITAPKAGAELWKHACSIAGRNLSEDEWEFFFGEEEWRPTCTFE